MMFTFLRLLYTHGEYLTLHVGCDKTLIDAKIMGCVAQEEVVHEVPNKGTHS